MRKPIVKLISFGGGGASYRESAERLISQSKDFPSIDERRAYSDNDLPREYFDLFKGLTKDYALGFGVYSWKAFLINAELENLEPNDILIYIDGGCELNKHGIRRFDDYLSHTAKNGVLLFELQHPNRFWTKNHPKLMGYPEHFFRNQLASGVLFLKNTEETRQMIKMWLDLCSYENGLLLKDPDESEQQLPGFMKHRHDQSCLSICAYQHNVIAIPDETWFQDWSYAKNYPILALRNRTGTPTLHKKLKISIVRRIKTFIKMLRT